MSAPGNDHVGAVVAAHHVERCGDGRRHSDPGQSLRAIAARGARRRRGAEREHTGFRSARQTAFAGFAGSAVFAQSCAAGKRGKRRIAGSSRRSAGFRAADRARAPADRDRSPARNARRRSRRDRCVGPVEDLRRIGLVRIDDRPRRPASAGAGAPASPPRRSGRENGSSIVCVDRLQADDAGLDDVGVDPARRP